MANPGAIFVDPALLCGMKTFFANKRQIRKSTDFLVARLLHRRIVRLCCCWVGGWRNLFTGELVCVAK